MNYKIKIITGFRKEQEYSISAEEAHKAYYLFANPDERGIFADGLALRGSDIRAIEPDYQGTMGWNHTHQLTGDDWNEIRDKGMLTKMREIMNLAKEVAHNHSDQISQPLSQLKHLAPGTSSYADRLVAGMK